MQLTESIHLATDPDTAWGVLADFAADPRWRHAVDEMTPDPAGPARPGQRVREVLTFRGTTYVTDMRLLDVGARRLVFDGVGASTKVHGVRRVDVDGGATVATIELSVRLRGARRVLEPVMGPMYRRQVRADLRQLGRLFGSESGASESGGSESAELVAGA